MTNSAHYDQFHQFLAAHVISPFYEKRLKVIKEISLKKVLMRKNPYLSKAKNFEFAADLVKSIVDAFLSSQEETVFGNLLEGFAIHVSETLHGGFKSARKSLDLEFARGGVYYIVGIKSGIYWGNADQIQKMRDNFAKARKELREEGFKGEIVAVNGCIYGKDANPLKSKKRVKVNGKWTETDVEPEFVYFKYAGQDFWHFISGDDNLYREIIKPIDEEARQRDETFKKAYTAKINEMTEDFMKEFLTESKQIDWLKLVDHVSKRVEKKEKKSQKAGDVDEGETLFEVNSEESQ